MLGGSTRRREGSADIHNHDLHDPDTPNTGLRGCIHATTVHVL